MTSDLMDLAASFCPGRIILSLEGGYHLQGLAHCVEMVILTLSGEHSACRQANDHAGSIHDGARAVIDRAKTVLSPYWGVL
jgi:acetoin utilization deacetylase AcuC-like enzyme